LPRRSQTETGPRLPSRSALGEGEAAQKPQSEQLPTPKAIRPGFGSSPVSVTCYLSNRWPGGRKYRSSSPFAIGHLTKTD